MDAFFIVTAILLSVWMLFGFAVPIGKPKISAGERMSDTALEKRFVMLGKECSRTRRGFGMKLKRFNVNRAIKAVEKKYRDGVPLTDWENELLFNAEVLKNGYAAGLSGVRFCYTLGHVNGDLPRLFVLCAEIVRCTDGGISKKSVKLCVDAFERNAPLIAAEKKYFREMLLFCLCGYVCTVTNAARVRTEVYRNGVRDGETGKVDLDRLNNDWYVGGLFSGSGDIGSVNAVLENNGVDASRAIREIKRVSATTVAAIRAAVRSVTAIRSDMEKNSNNRDDFSAYKRDKRLTVLTILPCALTAATAVLVCAFVSPRFAALFVVFAVIFYGCFRLPVLLNYPYAVFDFLRFFKPRKRKKHTVAAARADSEIAYFDGEAENTTNTLIGNDIKISCGGNGNIRIYSGGKKYDRLEIGIATDELCVGLERFFGLHAKNKTVYRLITDKAEFTAELIASAEYPSCILRLACVNRTPDESIEARYTARLLSACCGKILSQDAFAKIVSDGGAVGMAFDCAADYDGESGVFAGHKFAELFGECALSVKSFTRAACTLRIVYRTDEKELEQILRVGRDDNYWEFADDAASVFGGDAPKNNVPELCAWRYIPKTDNNKPSDTPTAPFERSIDIDEHGYTDCGDFVPSSCAAANTLTNGLITVKCYKNTLGDIRDAKSGKKLFAGENVAAVFGADRFIWSVFSCVCDEGRMTTVFGRNRTKYFCAYNGFYCRLDVYPAASGRAVMFDISISCADGRERDIDALFSAACGAGTRIICDNNRLSAAGESSFSLACSAKISEYATREEAWLSGGVPQKTSGFVSSGATPAAVVSVKTHVVANGTEHISFCLSFDDQADRKNVDAARDVLLDRIVLCSDDRKLNVAYALAAYNAYVGVVENNGFDVASLYCCKYFDGALVKSRLAGVLSEQAPNGSVHNADAVYCCFAVADYVAFTRDYPFLNAVLPFADSYRDGRHVKTSGTVKEHCFAALDALCRNGARATVAAELKAQSFAFGFFSRLCGGDTVRAARYKNIARELDVASAAAMQKAIDAVATRFRTEKEALTCAIAMYLGGEYALAYDIIRTVTDKFIKDEAFFAERRKTQEFAIYYVIVTELLLGIRLRGNRVKLNPRTAKNCPKIGFDISDGDKTAHIDVDNGEFEGDWRIKVDRISYAIDSITVTDKFRNIVLYRDGNR